MQEKNSGLNRKFCERVRDRRLRLGLNAQEYADLLGVSRSRLGNWEAQINSAPRSVITALARKLNVSDAWLAGEDDALVEAPALTLHDESVPYTVKIGDGVRGECMAHLAAFLATCREVPSRLGWTLEELRRHFPLNRWQELNEASSARPKPKTVEEALALTEERERARDQSPEVPVTIGRSGGPSRRKQRPGAT